MTGGSFSSVDALPAISREFSRPSPKETRRPATAGGALQSRSPFAGFMPGGAELGRFSRIDTSGSSNAGSDGDEMKAGNINQTTGGVFATTNPFSSSPRDGRNEEIVPSQTPTSATSSIDPRFIPSRRASAPQPPFNGVPDQVQSNMWSTPNQSLFDSSQYPLSSAPAHVTQFNMMSMQRHSPPMQSFPQPPSRSSARPQTSDGIPSFLGGGGSGVALPPAKLLVDTFPNSLQTYLPTPPQLGSAASIRSFDSHDGKGSHPYSMPYRDARLMSVPEYSNTYPPPRHYPSDADRRPYPSPPGTHKVGRPEDDVAQSYMGMGGAAPKKRPRRRFDEIERHYVCGWEGCEKGYGTLNHLNAHVAMQKHGEKRLPAQFKELRKTWRKKKREAQAAMINSHIGGPWPNRGSFGSSSGSDDAQRYAYPPGPGMEYDRRDSGSSMLSSSSDFDPARVYMNRGAHYMAPSYGNYTPSTDSRPNTSSSMASSMDGSGRPYASRGSYPFMEPVPEGARRQSAPTHVTLPPQSGLAGFRTQEDHPTPTQQNPNPFGSRPQTYNGQFQTLTSPMTTGGNGAPGSGYEGQFAFHR